jgi:protein required for attachment to host cells
MNYQLDHQLFLLADGHHFLLMARDLYKPIPHLKIIKRVQYQPSKFRKYKKDNPGITMSKIRQSHTSYAYTDLSSVSDGRYLAVACQSVDEVFKQGAYKAITLIGNPKFLNQVKTHLSNNMKQQIQCEIHKNYTKLPIEKLEHALMLM